MLRVGFVVILSLAGIFAASAEISKGEAEAKRACLPCHSMRIVAVHRLSRATWDRELTKMENWGAVIRDRQLLLDWLTEKFGENTPAPLPLISRDGRTKER
jgi:hypothetical protein